VSLALLDANVLLALAWPNHQHHVTATRWFETEASTGWATCALTELAFIRLSSNRAFSPYAVTPAKAAQLLSRLTAHHGHHYWPHLPPADLAAIYASCTGHQQVNDAYLLAVASREAGRLVTFDARIAYIAGNSQGFTLLT
jgi:uncharacterized protein